LAHSRSAKKRVRQNERRRLRNRVARSALRSAVKRFRAAASAGDLATARAIYAIIQKRADTIARKGIIPAKRAARIKSRLAAALGSAPAPAAT